MICKFSPCFEWLAPYVELGMKYVNSTHKLSRVSAWTYGKSRGKNEAAAIYQTRKGEPHRIYIHTQFDANRPHSKIDILSLLAHEIAHMEDWKHTTKHKRLEAKILRAFMKLLESQGYVSEEEEFRPIK